MPTETPTWETTDFKTETPTWESTDFKSETPTWDKTTFTNQPSGPKFEPPVNPSSVSSQFALDAAKPVPTEFVDTSLSDASMKEEAFKPSFNLPKLEINPDDNRFVAAGKQLVNVASSIPEFFSSPAGAAAFVSAGVLPTATAAVFTGDMLYSLGKQAIETYGNVENMTPAEMGKVAVDLVTTGWFAKAAGIHSVKGTIAAIDSLKESIVPGSVEMPAIETKDTAAVINNLELNNGSLTAAATKGVEENSISISKADEEVLRSKSEGAGGVVELQGVGTVNPQPEVTSPAQAQEIKPSETAPPPDVQSIKSPSTKTLGESAAPEIIGMGGAAAGEIPDSGLGKEIYGIAQRVREERARAGAVIEVQPGAGTTTERTIDRGRALLEADPQSAETVLTRFEADPNKAVSVDDLSVTRAKGEQLALIARRAEEKFGTDSQEFHDAWVELSAWDLRTKPLQTEWHKQGMAQQGHTDIDTGSFTGLQRTYRESTDKDFTPEQENTAKEISGKVRKAAGEADTANVEFTKALDAERTIKQERTKAEQEAIDAANKTVREAAARLAEAERKQSVAEAKLKTATENLARKPIESAVKSADKTVREAAIRNAKIQVKRAEKEARQELKIAEIESKREQKALDAANKIVREAAIKRSQLEQKYQNDPRLRVLEQVHKYLDDGWDNFHDIRTKVATDLGISSDQVSKIINQTPRIKHLADDLWLKQQKYRRFDEAARRWINDTQVPMLNRALASIPRTMFAMKVGFHGTVALGTHAPALAFQPRFWGNYIKNFGRMYKLVGSRQYYELQVQDLIRRKNYVTARRSGLVNDPFTYEDFNNPDLSRFFGGISGMGNRGYTVLKILRQDLFDQHWNAMPRTLRSPEMAELLSDSINHVTGVTKGMSPPGANVALFAPRLLASRAMWLAGDPVKAAGIVANWKNASREERYFATQQIKEKLWVAGTFFSLLAVNQGLLSATGSDQKINGIPESLGGAGFNPMKSDFLKFKAAGMQGSYGNAMITAARLPIRIYATASGPGGKLRNLVYPDEDTAKILFEFARSQASPFAGTITDLVLRADFQNRPLPHSERPIPKRLRERGVEPYTWTEYVSLQASPIPIQEGLKEVWGQGFGMTPEQIDHYLKAMVIISIMSGTGGRIGEDWDVARPMH